MSAENKDVPNGDHGEDAPKGAPPAPPQEEPPKMEEIITREVLDDIIKGYNPNMKFVSFAAEIGSKAGDNYMSIMYAVDIEMEDKNKKKETLKTMVKTIPRNAIRQEMITEMKAFLKEACIYQEVFPALLQMQIEKKVPKALRYDSWPKCYATHVDGTTDYIAMENLRQDGFKMGNRQVGLDFNHCALVLRSLARLHATSYVYGGGSRERLVEQFPALKTGMFTRDSKNSAMQQQFFAHSFVTQADSLKSNGEELAASRMYKLGKSDFVSLIGDLIEKDVDVAVVSHGDCWLNNMLFKYDDNDDKCKYPTMVKFLDFQLSAATSRIIDVYYFLMTSAKLDMLGKFEQELQMIYYTEFTTFSSLLGVDSKAKGLTWDAFLKEVKRYRIYGVCLGILLAPMLEAQSKDIPDMDSFTQEDLVNVEESMKNFFKDMSKGQAFLKAKTIVLDYLPKCENAEKYL